jgi:hypothetical protein
MSANINPIFPLVVACEPQTFAIADTTDMKILFTGGTNGSRIDAISAISTDTVNQLFTLALSNGTTNYGIGELTVTANAGTNGTVKSLSLLTANNFPWLDSSGSIYIKSGWFLKAGIKTGSVTVDKLITIVCMGGDY